MIDKNKLRMIVQKFADKGYECFNDALNNHVEGEWNDEFYWDGYSDCAGSLLKVVDAMQEEPVSSVWHDMSEKPKDKSKVVVWTGDEMVQCHYMYGKFAEKIPTEECGHTVKFKSSEGTGEVYVSKRKRADLTELVVKWAYVEDLLNDKV